MEELGEVILGLRDYHRKRLNVGLKRWAYVDHKNLRRRAHVLGQVGLTPVDSVMKLCVALSAHLSNTNITPGMSRILSNRHQLLYDSTELFP